MKNRVSQADAFEMFLTNQGSDYRRVGGLIQIMIVCAVNASVIERGYNYLKIIVSPTRSSLKPEQIQRLLLLAVNLPDLSHFDVDKVVAIMASS